MSTDIDDIKEMFSNVQAYSRTVMYVDTRQYDECFGYCEEKEIHNKETKLWLLIRCLYCHADSLPCLGITQNGAGCRRTTNLGREGLCGQHDGSRYR